MSLFSPRPEVHGHRGCRGLRPENTLPAFLHALALGVDVLELDVVISADNKVVVSHEPWLNPHICLDFTGRPIKPASPPQFNLYQLPYAAIRQSDCGQLRHPSFPEQVLQPAYKPLLSEVLGATEASAALLRRPPVAYSVEIKSSLASDTVFHPLPTHMLSLVLADLAHARVLSRTTILSFDSRILELVHEQMPDLATCLLAEEDQPWLVSLQQLSFIPTTLGPNFLSVTSAAVRQLRDSFPKLRLVPWTVNEVADMQHLRDLGVDGITTDYPDRLLTLLN